MVKEHRKGYCICICDWCGEEFARRTGEVNRSLKKGMGQFHKGSCATRWLNAHPTERMKEASRATLKKHGMVRKVDEMSPFRYFHKIIRNRRTSAGELRELDLTLQDLSDLWDEQGGVCPYTGIEMQLPRDPMHGWSKEVLPRFRPSLDRIDSSRGYIKGNVQFISQMANHAKNSHSHDEMVAFCRAIAAHWA